MGSLKVIELLAGLIIFDVACQTRSDVSAEKRDNEYAEISPCISDASLAAFSGRKVKVEGFIEYRVPAIRRFDWHGNQIEPLHILIRCHALLLSSEGKFNEESHQAPACPAVGIS